VAIILFVTVNLATVPKYGPEEINVATVADRQANMESTINKLVSTVDSLRPDTGEVEQRLKDLNCAVTAQLDKLSTLSDQLTATATLIQNFGGPAHHRSNGDSDRDRSLNVVMFGINEHRDVSVWRQDVLNALHHILGRPAEVNDIFRIGRYVSGKARPVIVKLHSAWDRRLVVSSSYKLKSYNEHVLVSPDESLEARRKRQLNRLKVRAERDNKTVCVNDGILFVDNVSVFSVKDGFIEQQHG